MSCNFAGSPRKDASVRTLRPGPLTAPLPMLETVVLDEPPDTSYLLLLAVTTATSSMSNLSDALRQYSGSTAESILPVWSSCAATSSAGSYVAAFKPESNSEPVAHQDVMDFIIGHGWPRSLPPSQGDFVTSEFDPELCVGLQQALQNIRETCDV